MWNFISDVYVRGATGDAIALRKWSTAHPDRGLLQYALQRLLGETGRVPEMATMPRGLDLRPDPYKLRAFSVSACDATEKARTAEITQPRHSAPRFMIRPRV